MSVIVENRANKRSTWQATPTNVAYPSEKLVKDTLDTKVKLTKMPDGATAVYSQDAWATADSWQMQRATASYPSAGIIRATYTSGIGGFGIYRSVAGVAGKTMLIRCRTNKTSNIVILDYNGAVYSSTTYVNASDVEFTTIKYQCRLDTIHLYIYSSNLVAGDWIEYDWIWIGDYSYLDNTISTEASRIANQLGDTAGVGTKASGTITSNGTNVSDGDTVTIAGKVYTFKTALTPAEGEVKIGSDAGASISRLYWAINRASPETHDGVNYKIAEAHPLVIATTVNPYLILTLNAKSNGLLGNSITLAKSASTLTLSGSTLTGGVDDVGAKVTTQLESAHRGVPKFNSISFPATQVPSSDPNTLDDYEEGTWTPVPNFGGNSTDMAFTVLAGIYTKIGRKVLCSGNITFSNKGSATGEFKIGGLPFTSGSSSGYVGAVSINFANITFSAMLSARINNGASEIVFRQIATNGSSATITESNFSNTSSLFITAEYQV